MLQIRNLVKDYVQKGIETVHALRNVSIDFRSNEFVAILGPSGCGKTTFLNIIGGLDRYTSGDLLIKGKSTKKYKDKDWDTYRNHSVGFVFQSYNLIPHQTVLQNVELALTISGISKKERKIRAKKALEKVGLGGMENKKPNQMSGGQMQRVAIARALVNDPEILLADEPTGALDSKTSIAIMELLKEVAKNRLVIMVTHNPELANNYASRIINILDGKIIGDSNPYKLRIGNYVEKPTKKKNKGNKYSQMKFFTAFGLSLSNLFSKLKRTALVAIAGSIGIIGVSSVLAVSQGIKNYISSMQDDMLSSYPISISEESVDYSALMTGLQEEEVAKEIIFDKETSVGLDSMIDYLMSKYKDFTSVKTNDINENLLTFLEDIPEGSVAAKKYDYSIDVTNNIFTTFKQNSSDTSPKMMSLNGITQMYISTLKTVEGFSDYAQFVDLFTDFMKELPDSKDYVVGDGESGQYKMLCGEYPTSENDILLVVDKSKQSLTDLIFAQLGFYPEDEFLNIAKRAIAENDPTNEDYGKTSDELDEKYPYDKSFTYETLLNKKLTYYPHDSIYSYGEVEGSDEREISGTFMNMLAGMFGTLSYDFENDNFTGIAVNLSDMSNYQSIVLARSENSPYDEALPQYGNFEGSKGGEAWKIKIVNESGVDKIYDITTDPNPITPIAQDSATGKIFTDEYKPTVNAFKYDAVADENTENGVELRISGVAIANDDTEFGCLSRGVYYTKEFADKFISDASTSNIITDEENGIFAHIGSEKENASSFSAYVTYEYDSYKEDPDNAEVCQGYASALNADLTTSLSSLFSGFSGSLNYYEVDKIYLRSLSGLSVKKIPATNSSVQVFAKTVDSTSYCFEKLPQSISLYPTSFAQKYELTDYLDSWNEDKVITLNGVDLTKDDRDDLTYTDTIETIITVINTLIDIVSVALIIFTSLSLVVSCFMIAVITYISVMERVKEIGIIRSLGGRKKDVTRLFTAENLITGLSSGVIGVGFTYLLQTIANIILVSLTYPAICALSIKDASIMIALSIFLSVISGSIPSRNASRQDPVIALRTE